MPEYEGDIETGSRRLLGAILVQAAKDAQGGNREAVTFLQEASDLFKALDLDHSKVVRWLRNGCPGGRIYRLNDNHGRRERRRRKPERTPLLTPSETEPVQPCFALA